MEKKINIAEILKDCPKGMELDCTIYEDVILNKIDNSPEREYPIQIVTRKGYLLDLTKYGTYIDIEEAKCVIFPKGETTWEGFVPPYKFKDGDVLVHTQNDRFIMSIYKSNKNEQLINTHAILWDREEGLSVGMQICCYTDNVRLATEEEKQKLFDAIKANGYKWNEETKTLEKLIEPKFKEGDRVRHKVVNKNDVHEINRVYDDSYGFVGFPYTIHMKYQDKYELVSNKFDISTLKPFDNCKYSLDGGKTWKFAQYWYIKDKYDVNEIEIDLWLN